MNTNNQLYTAWSTILTFYIYVMINKLMLVETAAIIRDKHINLNKPHKFRTATIIIISTHYIMTTIQQHHIILIQLIRHLSAYETHWMFSRKK